MVVNNDGHVVQAVVDEGLVEGDDGPGFVDKVYGAAEYEVFFGRYNPVVAAVETALVGAYQVDVQVAVARSGAVLEEIDALDESSLAQFLGGVNLLGV